MTAGEFVSDRVRQWLLWGGVAAVAALFLRATGTQGDVLLLVFLAWILIAVTAQVSAFFRQRAHLQELESILGELDQKHLFAECVPKPQSHYEQKLFALMRQSGCAMIESVSAAQASQREYREYIEGWVHEIKTPITAAQLLCRTVQGELRRKLSRELAQIENHVERALFYARAESAEQDCIIRQTPLADLVTEAIEHHRSLMIQSGVGITTEGLECSVYTDGKWVVFMLGQLLQNAVRYRSETPAITISARQLGRRVQLTVHDNGIGIPAHELPRVFERGFTGSNGRARGGSTGIGLYLCRRLARFLEMNLQIESEQGQGTSVILTFPGRENLSKV